MNYATRSRYELHLETGNRWLGVGHGPGHVLYVVRFGHHEDGSKDARVVMRVFGRPSAVANAPKCNKRFVPMGRSSATVTMLSKHEWIQRYGRRPAPVSQAFKNLGWRWQPVMCTCKVGCILDTSQES